MTEPTETAAAPEQPRRATWRRKLLIAAIALLLLLLGGVYAYRAWLHSELPDDAPRIGFAQDDFWLNQTGATFQAYDIAVARAGGRLVELDIAAAGDPIDPARIGQMLDGLDGLIIGGGGDIQPSLYGGSSANAQFLSPRHDALQLELIRQARARRLPLLGVCRGCQLLNVSAGGTLKDLREDPEVHARHFMPAGGHPLNMTHEGRLAEAFGLVPLGSVTSTHQWGLGRLGRAIRPVAWADAERKEIEAIEAIDADWLVGIMWHPERESVTSDLHLAPFRALVAQARAHRR